MGNITLVYKDVKSIHDTLIGRSSPAQSSMEVFTFLSFAIWFYKVEINIYWDSILLTSITHIYSVIYDINYTSRLRNYVYSNKQSLLRGRILIWSICTIMVAPSPIWRRFYLTRIMILFTATVSRLILLCLEFTCVTPACNNFYKSNKKVLLGSQLWPNKNIV